MCISSGTDCHLLACRLLTGSVVECHANMSALLFLPIGVKDTAITCALAMLRAGIVFGGVCPSVPLFVSLCASVRRKFEKLPVGRRCSLVGIWAMVNVRGGWKLVTFDLDLWPWELFPYFFNSGNNFWMALLYSNSIFGMGIHLRISRLYSSFKVMVQGQGHGIEKTVACSLKTTGRKFLEFARNIYYDNARSGLEFLTFDLHLWPWKIYLYFFNSVCKFWSSQLHFRRANMFSEYLGHLWVSRLISRSRSQKAAARRFVLPRCITAGFQPRRLPACSIFYQSSCNWKRVSAVTVIVFVFSFARLFLSLVFCRYIWRKKC